MPSMEGKDFYGKFEKSFETQTPHTEVIIDLRLYIFGDWQREPIFLQIDDQSPFQLLAPYSRLDHTLTNWCGPSEFKDNIVRINRAFIHNSEKLILKIFEQDSTNSDQKSWAISDIDLKLIVQCPANSIQNNLALCTCNSGFYSSPLLTCPSTRSDICQKCLPCGGYCASCSLINSKFSCDSCSEGLSLENGICIAKAGKKYLNLFKKKYF
jgi:hypothetical protein